MNTCKHRLSLSVEKIDNDTLLSLKITGTLTQDDYKLIAPMINFALEGVKNPKVRVLVDGTQVEGHDLMVAWDCFKLGLKHGNEFEKEATAGRLMESRKLELRNNLKQVSFDDLTTDAPQVKRRVRRVRRVHC